MSCVLSQPGFKLTDDELKRFMDKVSVDLGTGCWEWFGFTNPHGYGQLTLRGKVFKSHRVLFAHHNGIIANGLLVCHRCDNPRCVNPKHLFLGTQKDNMNDMKRKGRQAQGGNNGRSKLDERDVQRVRKLYRQGNVSQKKLGERFNVSQQVVSAIVTRKIWTHLEDTQPDDGMSWEIDP